MGQGLMANIRNDDQTTIATMGTMGTMGTITATIDGTTVHLPARTTLLTAIRSLGKDLPTLCHSNRLTPVAGCRLCLVEEVNSGYVPACATPVKEGAAYRTESDHLQSIRQTIMKMILHNHPLHCRKCAVDGRCRLQRVAMGLGFLPHPQSHKNSTNLDEQEKSTTLDTRHPFIHRDNNLCIHCTLCVRACREIQGLNILAMVGRGDQITMVAGSDQSLEEAGCVSCGQCLFECPTGALQSVHADQPYEKEISSTCGYCGVGCKIHIQVANNRIITIDPDPQGSANRGHACVKGRFGFHFLSAPDRLQVPLIRQADGHFQESNWAEALALVAQRFLAIRQDFGADALAVVSSARCTNEENFILQKFARVVLGTNNIDNCARVCHSPSAFALGEALGTGAGTNSFEDIEQSEVLLLVGANPTEAHPVLGARIKRAVHNGCRLIVLDPRHTELARMADIHIPLRPGSNVAVINALQTIIITDKLFDATFIRDHAEGFAQLQTSLKDCTPTWAAQQARVDSSLIQQAAHLYASAKTAQILWGLGITESCQGTVAAFGLINMAIMTANLGIAGGGASPIRGQNNVQGACDMGALPNVFSDYQSVTNPAARKRHQEVWGIDPPKKMGLKMPEMLAAARDGSLKGLYLVAQDLAQSDPDSNHTAQALENLEFLVVQDLFMSESAKYATVILPGAAYLEKSGTFVNSDRRIQRIVQAVTPPGSAMSDGDITHHLARAMGVDLGFDDGTGTKIDPEKVMTEITSLTPNWGGVDYKRLETLGFLQWPCPHPQHPGTAIVHHDGHFIRGRARLTPTPWHPQIEPCNKKFPMMLTTGRMLFHYNAGSMTRRTAITRLHGTKQERLKINPSDAATLNIVSGETIRISSRQDQIEVLAEVSEECNPGLLFMTFHYPETPTNRLIAGNADTLTLCPEYKVTAVRVEKIV